MKLLISKSLFVYALTLLLTLPIVIVVFFHNYSAGLHPADQDTIMIPIFDAVVLFLFLFVFLIAQAVLYKRGELVGSVLIIKIIHAIIFLVTLYILAGSAIHWLRPNYIPIGVGYGFSLLAYLIYTYSKSSLKRT
ncbi:hypothetical protein ACIOWK_34125 [Pseudomonas protegens]|uniref:hypothetical protein n=1 Tax=Pseudomonas protegens TaxID=380021 RepID=UPI00382BD45C